ncbi:MAG: VOC family protein [Acidobacteriota bacterium]|nr:VOC family protein [Acidobacteriota bacterium]
MNSSDAANRLVPGVSAVDHLLLGVSDLDSGIAWVEKATGVKAVVGGTHPGMGTRNALVSLGGKRYLEIIAPDPAQTAFNFRIDVRKLPEPRLVNWAAATSDIDALARKAAATGSRTFGPQAGSRARPDRKTLRWKTFGVMHDFGADRIDPIPFFIEWAADSVHPSQDSPKGCELVSFEIEHPNPAAVKKTLAALGIEADVRNGAAARLVATLTTPKGKVTLR